MAPQRILQNNLLIWVDGNINETEADTRHSLKRLRAVVRHVTVLTTIDACIQILQRIKNEKALIITSGSMGQALVRSIHPLPQVEAIYIFCGNVARHEGWTKRWLKIRGVHDRIRPICEALQRDVKQSNEDLTPISFVQQETLGGASEVDLNRLEPSFMYTTLFKRAFLDMEREPNERKALIKFCRAQFHGTNRSDLETVEEFNRDYRFNRAIWWYSRECFLYQMLNRALRLLESDIIVDMGFFLRDLHRQLEQLHHEQFGDYHGPPLKLFRGQGLAIDEFSKLQKSRGGLIAFNSFLSTSRDRPASLDFARRNSKDDTMVGILFVMTVDPTIQSATFANIEKHSYFAEKEILFSMHSVFRIGQVKPIDDSQRVFEVRLTLTSDDDPELRQLTDRMEKDIAGCRGWDRVARVLIDVGQMNKAKELYRTLLERDQTELGRGLYYHCLGLIEENEGDYPRAVQYYEKSIAIGEKTLSPTDPELATSYTGIGLVYYRMGEYSQALSYYNKALAIREKTLPANHPDLASSYTGIGLVHNDMGEYSQALSYYNKALGIREKTLPANHPDLATSYTCIGSVYDNMGEYSRALSYYNKALGIYKKTLPANHPDLATSYHNIGLVHNRMGEYSQALSYYNKALGIYKKTLPANHPDLATSYTCIGFVYNDMGEYSQALSYYNKALGIYKKTLPANHPDLANLYSNIGSVYDNMGEYSQTLSYYNKALGIYKKTLPANHPDLATSYHNIGATHFALKQYSTALPYFQKALAIQQRALSAGHPDTQSTLEWLRDVREKL